MTQLLAHFSAQWWTQHKTHFQFNSKSATISRKHHYRKTYILTAEVNFFDFSPNSRLGTWNPLTLHCVKRQQMPYLSRKCAILSQILYNFHDLYTFVTEFCRRDLHTFLPFCLGWKVDFFAFQMYAGKTFPLKRTPLMTEIQLCSIELLSYNFQHPRLSIVFRLCLLTRRLLFIHISSSSLPRYAPKHTF